MRPPSPIYFDNNATTRMDPAVVSAMQPFFLDRFANPSSPYTAGRSAATSVAEARARVAALIDAQPGEIVFTSGGTESNNAALHSAVFQQARRPHLVTTSVEHASVLAYARHLERLGHPVTFLRVGGNGQLDLDELRAAVTDETALVSVMAANNETGVMFPVEKAAAIAHERGALFHTDAVQAAGKTLFSARASGADFASLGAHKMHGPKGVGALYVRAGAPFVPYLAGGDQEYGRRAGTENVPAIAGFGRAAELSLQRLDDVRTRVRALRDDFERLASEAVPDLAIVGREAERLPNTSNLLIRGVESEPLVARLDLDGICCSSGSACAAGAHEPSHVLRAMGLPVEEGWGVLRVSFCRFDTAAEMEYLVGRLSHNVKVLRDQG